MRKFWSMPEEFESGGRRKLIMEVKKLIAVKLGTNDSMLNNPGIRGCVAVQAESTQVWAKTIGSAMA
jgi:hypothetical protein